MFAEKMASVIGPSYVISFFVGAAIGLTNYWKIQSKRDCIRCLFVRSHLQWHAEQHVSLSTITLTTLEKLQLPSETIHFVILAIPKPQTMSFDLHFVILVM